MKTEDLKHIKVGGSWAVTGYNYVIASYPLKEMDLVYGDVIQFQLGSETESKKYDHASVDVLLGEGISKNPATIKYKIGSNKYEIVANYGNEGKGK